jgi:hypothetical protein
MDRVTMRGLAADEGWNVPFDSPFYPALPAHYEDVSSTSSSSTRIRLIPNHPQRF